MIKRSLLLLLGVMSIVIISVLSVTQLNDCFSQNVRARVQNGANAYLVQLSRDVAKQQVSAVDKAILHIGALSGVLLSAVPYPEASRVLYHYIYGKGEDLQLSSNYFENSTYLQGVLQGLGDGQHGPLTLHQGDDWRLSLALNPYFLNLENKKVRIFHPHITFASAEDESVFTLVPIGKLQLKVYDNIVSALNPTSFYVFAEWPL